MADEVTLKILEAVANDANLPLHTTEAAAIASLERFRELKDAGLIDCAVVRGNKGEVVKVRISSITHHGRTTLNAILERTRSNSPVRRSMKHIEKLIWMLIGVGMTLLGLWLAKALGLK